MKIKMLLLFLLFFTLAKAQECLPCDTSCGNWSCITNCSQTNPPYNPTFDVPRCAVDSNGNSQIDDCSELLACQNVGGKYVCPVDTGDSLCTSNEWSSVKPYDTNPNDFDAEIWGFYLSVPSWNFPTYQQKLLSYNLSCPNPPQSSSDSLYQFAVANGVFPVWVCGGALYSDVWFSYDSCSYISYDGSQWQVKNNACSDPNKIWQKISQKCYATSWSHSIYVYLNGQTYYLTWNVPVPQGSFNQNQYVNVSGQSYKVNMRCISSTNVSTSSGQSLQLCTIFQQTVYDPSNNVLYTLYWYPDSQWNCPVMGGSQSSSYTYETMSPLQTQTFTGILEERQNNITAKGAGVDTQGRRCRICSTSLQGLSGGVEKNLNIAEGDFSGDFDRLAQCVNPRFFSGDAKSCRPGGLTTLGASCCGLSGWTKGMCSKGEKELKKRREAGTCSYVGDYCSKKVLGVCLEKKRSFCCFYSKISRIFNECGRPQIGKGWGTGKRPDCSGFTIDEFAGVDFSHPNCLSAIEQWATEMANSFGDRITEQITNKAVDGIQSWLSNVKNQKDYGGEK